MNNGIKKDLCTLYGAFVGVCPSPVAHMGRVVLKDVFTAYDTSSLDHFNTNIDKIK